MNPNRVVSVGVVLVSWYLTLKHLEHQSGIFIDDFEKVSTMKLQRN